MLSELSTEFQALIRPAADSLVLAVDNAAGAEFPQLVEADDLSELELEYAYDVMRLMDDTAAINVMFDLGVTIAMWSAAFQVLEIAPMGLSSDGRNFLQPCVANGEVVDLVSWRPADPSTWTLHYDLAALIGEEAADRAAWFDDVLEIHATPLDWIRHCGRGAVVLDWSHYLPSHIQCRRLLVKNRSLARRLHNALVSPAPNVDIRCTA